VRILLIRLSSLGDIVLTTPVFAFIKEAVPDAELDFLCYTQYSAIMAQYPEIHRVLCFPKQEMTRALRRMRLIRFWRLAKSLRCDLAARRYDHVIDLHNVTDSALAALMCPKAIRTGNRRQLLTVFFAHRLRLEDRNERAEMHASLIAMRTVLESGALPAAAALPILPKSAVFFDENARAEAERFIQVQSLAGKKLVGIYPAASRDYKRWPAENFARLAGKIVDTWGYAIVLLGAASDRALMEKIAAEIYTQCADAAIADSAGEPISENVVIACGLDLPVVCALLARLDFCIGADSGLMHIAAALNVPQVALFGHSSLLKFYPLSDKARVVRHDLPCSPCTPQCARKCAHRICIEGITVTEVWREAVQLIAEYYPELVCSCGRSAE
jgi:lipopolysaccharide heptosyltransferase II